MIRMLTLLNSYRWRLPERSCFIGGVSLSLDWCQWLLASTILGIMGVMMGYLLVWMSFWLSGELS